MGGGNLGDDATQTAVMQNIRKRWPNCEICGFTMNPSDTQSRHGIHSYPIRVHTWTLGDQRETQDASIKQAIKATVGKYSFLYSLITIINRIVIKTPRLIFKELSFLAKSFRVLRSFDILIVSGGGQLLDHWGGPWQFPYTIFKWVFLAKLARVECIVLNVGAGKLTRPLSQYFVRRALSLADYVSFRDKTSKALARDIGFNGEAHVFPDCVYGLDIGAISEGSSDERNRPVVGIAPMAYGDKRVYRENDPNVYNRLVHNLDLFGSWLISKEYRLALFCSDIGVDPPAVEDLRTLIVAGNPAGADSVIVCSLKSGTDLLRNMASMDYAVTCRFHGVVFAHMLNLPVIAISHHPKVVTLMNDLGLSEYCVDIHTCDMNMLTEAFASLVRNGPAIKRRMADRLAYYEGELSKQFDELFPQDVLLPYREHEQSSATLV
jgi:polysaccharide pyruvyl transferase WcaK-like protein